jgi:hypothetical protein
MHKEECPKLRFRWTFDGDKMKLLKDAKALGGLAHLLQTKIICFSIQGVFEVEVFLVTGGTIHYS